MPYTVERGSSRTLPWLIYKLSARASLYFTTMVIIPIAVLMTLMTTNAELITVSWISEVHTKRPGFIFQVVVVFFTCSHN